MFKTVWQQVESWQADELYKKGIKIYYTRLNLIPSDFLIPIEASYYFTSSYSDDYKYWIKKRVYIRGKS